MKKPFPLHVTGKQDARVLDTIKHDIRKYVNRERRKTLPPEAELWTFTCRVGASADTAVDVPLKEVGPGIDAVAQTGVESVYVEVTATPSRRPARATESPALGDVSPT